MKLDQVARWTELVASIGVIVTLVLLVREVHDNTLSSERQTRVERANTLYAPFLRESQIPAILAKVKAVDGPEGLAVAYMERYGLTYEEASIWTRYQGAVWSGLEADFVLLGESPEIDARIRSFLDLYPDFRLWWESASGLVSPDFRTYVERLRRQP